MLLLQVFIRLSKQFGRFSEQQQGNLKNKVPAEKNKGNFVSTNATICHKQIVNSKFFQPKILRKPEKLTKRIIRGFCEQFC